MRQMQDTRPTILLMGGGNGGGSGEGGGLLLLSEHVTLNSQVIHNGKT